MGGRGQKILHNFNNRQSAPGVALCSGRKNSSILIFHFSAKVNEIYNGLGVGVAVLCLCEYTGASCKDIYMLTLHK